MEYEVSFFDFDLTRVRKTLRTLGANRSYGLSLFKMAYFCLSGETEFKTGFLRLRDENGVVTLTTKIYGKHDAKFPDEYETTVNTTYENMVQLIKASGLKFQGESVKFREKWVVGKHKEVVFDVWPGLPMAMEVESDTEKSLKTLCRQLDLDYSKGFTMNKYKFMWGFESKVTQNLPELNFKNFRRLLRKHIKKNKALFESLTADYYRKIIHKRYHNLL